MSLIDQKSLSTIQIGTFPLMRNFHPVQVFLVACAEFDHFYARIGARAEET
jgi:hypothetical protein